MPEKFSLINMTKGKLTRLPFVKMKNDILGKDYSLSVAYVSEKKSKEINKKYRQKNKSTNVLSFSLRKNEGEIVMCPSVIKKECKTKKFEGNFSEVLRFLVIHGMLHLKGMTHSSTMDRAEKKYFKKYDQKHLSGNRRRFLRDARRGGRVRKGRKKS